MAASLAGYENRGWVPVCNRVVKQGDMKNGERENPEGIFLDTERNRRGCT